MITESIASQTVPPPAKVSRGVDACDLSANVNGPGAIATNGNVLCSRCRHSVLEDGPADNKVRKTFKNLKHLKKLKLEIHLPVSY